MLDALKLDMHMRLQHPLMRLRSMSRTTADLSNRLAASRSELSFSLRDATVKISPFGGVQDTSGKEWERTYLQIGERFFHLTFDQSVLQDLLDVSECFQDVAELSSLSAAVVFEHFFSDVLSKAEAHLEESITITGHEMSDGPDAEDFHLCFKAEYPLLAGGCVRFLLGGGDDDLSFLIKAFCALGHSGPQKSATDFLLPTTLTSQRFQIGIGDMRAFSEFDVILLSVRHPNELAQRIVVSGQIVGELTRGNNGLKLSGNLKPLHNNPQPKPENEDTMSAPEEDPVGFDDLTVSLHIEIDRKEILLSELQSLVAGSIVPFDSKTPEMVKVYAGGRFFAQGELVKVDEKVGVRLIQMA